MNQTYSTLRRDLSNGQVFSTQIGRVAGIPSGQTASTRGAPPQAAPSAAPHPTAASPINVSTQQPILSQQFVPAQQPLAPGKGWGSGYLFDFSNLGLQAANQVAPQGAGTVTFTRRGETWHASATIRGFQPPSDPAIQPTLWLVHDLIVPTDLPPADLAALPRGVTGAGNRPGTVFTLDGNPPTYGIQSNTVSVAISPGRFGPSADGTWRLEAAIDSTTNQSFHPFVLLGPSALADINAAVPSGVLARTLADLFMRPATRHPNLDAKAQFAQRLGTLAFDALTGPGANAFLDPSEFTRAAVTLEGVVRGTPRLMPTREACFLLANTRIEA